MVKRNKQGKKEKELNIDIELKLIDYINSYQNSKSIDTPAKIDKFIRDGIKLINLCEKHNAHEYIQTIQPIVNCVQTFKLSGAL